MCIYFLVTRVRSTLYIRMFYRGAPPPPRWETAYESIDVINGNMRRVSFIPLCMLFYHIMHGTYYYDNRHWGFGKNNDRFMERTKNVYGLPLTAADRLQCDQQISFFLPPASMDLHTVSCYRGNVVCSEISENYYVPSARRVVNISTQLTTHIYTFNVLVLFVWHVSTFFPPSSRVRLHYVLLPLIK